MGLERSILMSLLYEILKVETPYNELGWFIWLATIIKNSFKIQLERPHGITKIYGINLRVRKGALG